MKKIGLVCREKSIEQLQNAWNESESCVFVGFTKIGAFPFNRLRNDLVREKAAMMVSKNSLITRAIGAVGQSSAGELIGGSTGLVFASADNLVKACKILVDFSKANEGLSLQGGFLRGKRIGVNELEELSKLPSRDILLAQAVMMLASPLTGFVATLNNVILKLLWLIEELKKKKDNA